MEANKWVYQVVRTESPAWKYWETLAFPNKLHDGRTKDKLVHLTDRDCRPFTLKFLFKRN